MSDDPEITSLGGGRFQVRHGGRTTLAYGVADARQTWVFIEGQVHVIARQRGGTSASSAQHGGDEAALSTPMPATVADVKVTEGQQVARGDVLIVLEAMKMELPIVAPRDGVVREIACERGQLVQPGVPLVRLE